MVRRALRSVANRSGELVRVKPKRYIARKSHVAPDSIRTHPIIAGRASACRAARREATADTRRVGPNDLRVSLATLSRGAFLRKGPVGALGGEGLNGNNVAIGAGKTASRLAVTNALPNIPHTEAPIIDTLIVRTDLLAGARRNVRLRVVCKSLVPLQHRHLFCVRIHPSADIVMHTEDVVDNIRIEERAWAWGTVRKKVRLSHSSSTIAKATRAVNTAAATSGATPNPRVGDVPPRRVRIGTHRFELKLGKSLATLLSKVNARVVTPTICLPLKERNYDVFLR